MSSRRYRDRTIPYVPPKNPWLERDREEAKERRKKYMNAKRNEPEKIRFRAAVRQALKEGKIRRLDCELKYRGCEKSPTEAHHMSYDPGCELFIVWACKKCHEVLSTKEWKRRHAVKPDDTDYPGAIKIED